MKIKNCIYINNIWYDWKPNKADKYTITVQCKDLITGRIHGRTKTFTIKYPKLSVSFSKKSPQKRKTKIVIKTKINLPNKTYRYRIYNSKGKKIKDSKVCNKSSYTWKPTKKGTYKIKVYCKDLQTNKVITKTYKYKIK